MAISTARMSQVFSSLTTAIEIRRPSSTLLPFHTSVLPHVPGSWILSAVIRLSPRSMVRLEMARRSLSVRRSCSVQRKMDSISPSAIPVLAVKAVISARLTPKRLPGAGVSAFGFRTTP